MLFQYSTSKLLSIFIIRFLPTIPFFFLAIGIGEVFWLGIAFLWILLLAEMIWYKTKGYRHIDQEKLENFSMFNKTIIQRKDLKNILSYNNEWAFRTQDTEIRINRNHIKKEQRLDFDKMLLELQEQVKQQNP